MKSPQELKELHGVNYVEKFEKEQSQMRLDRLIKYIDLSRAHTVADFACGNGMLMESVAPKVKTYVGVDFSEPFVDAANNKKNKLGIENAEFFCSTIQKFCLEHKDVFDVGFSMDFSEHVYDQEWLEILRSIRNAIKPNGKLYLHTPNAQFFLEIMKNHDFIVKQFPEHIAVRTPEHNIDLLEKAGFRVNKLILLPHYNVLRYLHPLSYIPIIGSYFKARIFIEAVK